MRPQASALCDTPRCRDTPVEKCCYRQKKVYMFYTKAFLVLLNLRYVIPFFFISVSSHKIKLVKLFVMVIYIFLPFLYSFYHSILIYIDTTYYQVGKKLNISSSKIRDEVFNLHFNLIFYFCKFYTN